MVAALWLNTQFAFERFPYYLKLKKLEGKIFKPYVSISFFSQNYEIKTVDCPKELAQVLKLRFEVFFREFSTHKMKYSFFPFDIDIHDFACDHLIVKDRSTDEIVACYRLNASTSDRKVTQFYSEGEFELKDFLKLEGNKLELGRACVHKDYRKGSVVGLLWKGLLEYAKKAEIRYMFGCSSVVRNDFVRLPNIMNTLRAKDGLITEYHIDVQKEYSLHTHPEVNLSYDFPPLDENEARNNSGLNSIMHMYLMAGAKMGQTFAYDKEMDCLDFFTVMDLEKLPASFSRRFA
jgi:putative hemolysin